MLAPISRKTSVFNVLAEIYILFMHSIVPPPGVAVFINISRYISENIVTLSCSITLSSAVNNGERVVTTWSGPSGQVGNSSSVVLSGPYAISNGLYQSDITITAFDPGVHNGEYTCNATVIPSSSYVIGSSITNGRMVMITGQCLSDARILINELCSLIYI